MKLLRSQTGVSLIEVLVSLTILAIGILGIASLQALSLRNSNSASYRSIATAQAQDMADRIRANTTPTLTGQYNQMTGSPVNPGCIASGCTSANLANYDYWRWNNELANTLPSGAGVVCLDATPNDGTPASPACSNSGSFLVIKVWWDDDRNPTTLRRFTTVFQP